VNPDVPPTTDHAARQLAPTWPDPFPTTQPMPAARMLWILWCLAWTAAWTFAGLFTFLFAWLLVPVSLAAILIPIGGAPRAAHRPGRSAELVKVIGFIAAVAAAVALLGALLGVTG